MTQKEKARAYDEALERARALRQEAIDKGYAIDYVKDYEAIFPELAESEDERIRKELKEAFEAYDIESTWNGIPIRSIFAWLEKQKEQKPAEWSEEDKEMLLSIINAFRNGTVSTIGQEQWLKSLHKRFNLEPKQEWSEEDERIIERLIRLCTQYMVPDGVAKTCESWLRSLRPSWKPSEEQMKALQNAVALTACDKELARLYNQLKKL